MSNLKFRITEYKKFNTKRVGILHGQFKLDEDCKILEVNNTSYDYKKVVLKLSPEKADIMKGFEDEVNVFSEKNNIPKVTILYGNRIYPKIKRYLSVEKLQTVKLMGVFVNDENKSFPQLWLEY